MLSCANASDGRTTVASASRALSRARDDIARSLAQADADCNRLRPVRAEIPSARRRFLLEATPTEGTGAMQRAMTGRRAALDGLARILDAGAPEELFTGPEDEAHFLYGLLVDTARARASAHYWEICRTARRRSVTPDYVVDRAAVLLATIEERRRTDLYRILGVPPLSSGETIREHWLELAKRHHPDVGGDGARFRQAQQAYEILRDPARRAEYERFWLRALGPFERVAPREDLPPLEVTAAAVRAARPVVAGPPHPAAPAAVEPTPPASIVEPAGVSALLARVTALLASVRADDLERLRAELASATAELERARDQLHTLASLKHALEA
ncbi:MAG: J domain-containing protein [Deltaproteobacteria bacterium]|nr:MAG: J domain-containing protein [Deltaproteobacteria bacterium]